MVDATLAAALLQAVPVSAAIVTTLPYSLIPSTARFHPANLTWLVFTLGLLLGSFATAPFSFVVAFWLAFAGLTSAFALFMVLLLASQKDRASRELLRRAKTRRKKVGSARSRASIS